jgi:hypothetical protein
MPKGLTTGIIYIPLDVRWPRTKKVRGLIVRHGLDGLAAWSLYLAMACYCRENLSDGFVPADEIGALAYPLPPDQADGLLKLLLDHRLVGHSDSHSDGHSSSYGDSHSGGYVVRAYVKRNGTRADAVEFAEERARSGRAGAHSRWSTVPHSSRHSSSHSGSQRLDHAQTESETETESSSARARPPAPAQQPAATDDDDFHHQIVALLASSGHTVTYAEAVVIAETLLIGHKPRDPRPWLLRVIRNDPAKAVRVLVKTPERPVVRPALEVLAEDNHGGTDRVAEHAADARRLLGVQPPERPEAEPDLVAAAEEDDRLARQKARARARDPEPAPAAADVDDGLPDW